MIFAICKQLPDFPVMSESTLSKWCKIFRYCYKQCNKRLQVYQQFDVGFALPVSNFIKNETAKFFQPINLIKTRLQHSCFVVDFNKNFSLQLYQKRDPSTGVFL